ncbi:odorant-binding protein-like [Pteronotus mesoamericanus]|uniref:odorant-binding protein-like n=1 Tax=Pteronotus mesoamericanus TaxID=1884717 RepID=UPI0023EB3F29|nr:odorant-binding protein-like [Pteronotus parnellii mesoamericanus]
MTAVGTRIHGTVFAVDYAGANLYEIIVISETLLMVYLINLDENDEVTIITALVGRENHVTEVDFEKFMELTRDRNIPEGNIVNIIKFDNCPEN